MPVRLRMWMIRRREQRLSRERLHDLLQPRRAPSRRY
jgi:hypothetical protein